MSPEREKDIAKVVEEEVIPLIEEKYPEVAAEMIVRVNRLGAAPPESEVNILVEDRLWATQGGYVQLLLETSLEAPKEAEGVPGTPCCVGVWVQPLSWLRELRRFLETRSEASAPLPWEETSIEELCQIQDCVLIRDPRGIYQHLKNSTRPELFPGWLWDKYLIAGLEYLHNDALRGVRRALALDRTDEARTMVGELVADAMRLPFYMHRRYYPEHPHLLGAFESLPSPAIEALPHFRSALASADPAEQVAEIETVVAIYMAYLTKSERLPAVDLATPDMGLGDLDEWENLCQELIWANRCKAWSDPNWRDWVTRCRKEALEEGHPDHWWIYSLWDITREMPHM